MFDENIATIGVKELHMNLKSISERAAKGQEFIVIKHAKPIFKIVPVPTFGKRKKKKFNFLKEFEKAQFHSNDPALSQRIDEILYGD